MVLCYSNQCGKVMIVLLRLKCIDMYTCGKDEVHMVCVFCDNCLLAITQVVINPNDLVWHCNKVASFNYISSCNHHVGSSIAK
jgi:hypothetical protein